MQQLLMVEVYEIGGTFVGRVTLPLADPQLATSVPWPLIRDQAECGTLQLSVQLPDPDAPTEEQLMPPLQPLAHTPAVCPTPPPPACLPSRPSSIFGSSEREDTCHKRTGSAGQENQPPSTTPCHMPPLQRSPLQGRQLEQPRPAALFTPKPPEPPRGILGRHSPEEHLCGSGQATWSDIHDDRSTSYIPPPADMSAACFRSSASYSPPANRALGQGRQLPTLLVPSVPSGQAKTGASHKAAVARSPAPPGPVLNPVLFNRTSSGSQSPMAAGGPGTQPQAFKTAASYSIPPASSGCIAIGQPCAGMHALVGLPKFSMDRNQSYLPSPMRLWMI